MKYDKQVNVDHYDFDKYIDRQRWDSFYHQISFVNRISKILNKRKLTILEIGVGSGVVTEMLKKLGHKVFTMDIDPDLKPDIVMGLPQVPKKIIYDCVVCCEVLEHLKYEDSIKSLKELRRITKYIILSVPQKGIYVSLIIKIPLIAPKGRIFALPFSRIPLKFNGEHYWELGTNGLSVSIFNDSINEVGYEIVEHYRLTDNPYHHFFLLKK